MSERGLVTTDRTDHPEPVVRSWQNRIDKVVREMTDADTGVHIALAAVTVDSDVMAGGKGFNGAALGDIERYEARAAEDTLAKLSRGGHLSDTELTELERTFRDNSDDEAFSRTVLDDLGPTGTIRLTNELNDLVHIRPGHDAQRYATLETGLADAWRRRRGKRTRGGTATGARACGTRAWPTTRPTRRAPAWTRRWATSPWSRWCGGGGATAVAYWKT